MFCACEEVCPAAVPFLAASLGGLWPQRPLVLVAANLKQQETLHQDLQTWLEAQPGQTPARPLLFHPAWEALPHEAQLPHADVISERLETLCALAVPGPAAPVIVTSVAALLQLTFPPDEFRQRLRVLRRGDQLNPLDFIEWLEDQGYEPEAQVTQKGELALRGGIVDVYPPSSPWPLRLEFFGDELDSLRTFDPQTQISRDPLETVALAPAGELGLLRKAVQALHSGERPVLPKLATLLDYLPGRTLLLLCEPSELARQAGAYSAQIPPGDPFHTTWEAFLAQLHGAGMGRLDLSEAPEVAATQGGEASESIAPSEAAPSVPSPAMNPVPAQVLPGPAFIGLDVFRPVGERAGELPVEEAQRREFFAQIHRWLRQGMTVRVFCNNQGERDRFREIWRDYGLVTGAKVAEPAIQLGSLSRGFLFEEARLAVVTDAEIFGRYKVMRPRRMKSAHAQATRTLLDINFADLEEGDLVVHVQHGIGRYRGLQRLPANPPRAPGLGVKAPAPDEGQECLVLEYAPTSPDQPPPKLYVPVTEAHLVSKYVGAGRARPPLSTLGGARWAKAKAQTADAVRDLAAELLRLQAARASQPGYGFPPDQPWQREFESAFLYEETQDQLRAISETKADMEAAKPMDRLICGDVGFGKTEVAIRAAFKAVLAGKQVGILVPTTVLAQQHFNTFRERMADYPVRIELLSRFRTKGEQAKVLDALTAGAVDVVIGTHRVVQPDVQFKDLGLVIVDEEQRFGVGHKERLKQLRQMVDVLTLSATPIPRTLYMALTGARDLSTIETPPQDRLPVETIIAAYDERTVRDAIRRELNRGGQVFYLHNRVFDIESVAQRLRTLVPEARLAVGHGQMHADDLEEVMTKFIDGQVDVLLSTTIIESGIDIPNANTIIIDRADRFGLSDLYQLRGRVGRYKHQAYAYLLIPRHAGLLADARKRINAIKQFSSPGSGFKIAMRDLEIRGAGNLLGPEQSGYITAVGFDLYCQLLKQSISALKGEKVQPRVEVTVRLDFLDLNPGDALRSGEDEPAPAAVRPPPSGLAPANLPLSYVQDPRLRIEIYRKLAQATEPAALTTLKQEIRDRFGPLPPAVDNLLDVAELKRLAGERGITLIETREGKLMLTRAGDYIMLGNQFPRLTKKDPRARLKEIKKLLLALQPLAKTTPSDARGK